jgi:hypothetical protein
LIARLRLGAGCALGVEGAGLERFVGWGRGDPLLRSNWVPRTSGVRTSEGLVLLTDGCGFALLLGWERQAGSKMSADAIRPPTSNHRRPYAFFMGKGWMSSLHH